MLDRSLNYGRHLIRQFLGESLPFEHVLDIGAGSGVDLDTARAVSPSAKLYAVEMHPPQVEILKSRGIEVHQLDIEKDRLPLDNESADIIIANQILEHTKELFWIFHEISRVLKVGGNLILGVPNLASLHNRLLLLIGRQPTPIQVYSAHIRGFTKSGLVSFLNIFPGYSVIDCKGSNFYPFPPIIAKPLAKALPSLSWGIFLHIQKKGEYNKDFVSYLNNEKLETCFNRGLDE
jgi:SAM-dependent methyltransferase